MPLFSFLLFIFSFATIIFALFLHHRFSTAYKKRDEYIEKICQIFTASAGFQKMLKLFANSLKDQFRLTKIAIILSSKGMETLEIDLNLGFRSLSSEVGPPLQAILKVLSEKRGAFLFEEWMRKRKKDDSSTLKSQLKKIFPNPLNTLFLPFYHGEFLTGCIIAETTVGAKITSKKDMILLERVGRNAGSLLFHTKRYAETVKENHRLQNTLSEKTEMIQKLLAEIKSFDEEKSEFISIASHQLRTPTTIIKGFISMMLEGDFGVIPKAFKEPLGMVIQSTERLVHLIEDLLNVSRLESQRLQYNFQKCDLAEIVRHEIEGVQPQLVQKHLTIETTFQEPSFPGVFLDEEKIQQVLRNLFTNAVQYTQEGKIKIMLERKDGGALLTLRDTGIGIKPESMRHLFEKFSRIQEGKIVNTDGSGLGLFISKKLIEAHEGTIWAESEGVGKGTSFYIWLPVLSEPPKGKSGEALFESKSAPLMNLEKVDRK
jgi:signal transduction histidine kinase